MMATEESRPWSYAEDVHLMARVGAEESWTVVAANMPGRSASACRNRADRLTSIAAAKVSGGTAPRIEQPLPFHLAKAAEVGSRRLFEATERYLAREAGARGASIEGMRLFAMYSVEQLRRQVAA